MEDKVVTISRALGSVTFTGELDTCSSEAMNPYLPEFKVLHELAETCLVAASTN
jgi:hypothetical protein